MTGTRILLKEDSERTLTFDSSPYSSISDNGIDALDLMSVSPHMESTKDNRVPLVNRPQKLKLEGPIERELEDLSLSPTDEERDEMGSPVASPLSPSASSDKVVNKTNKKLGCWAKMFSFCGCETDNVKEDKTAAPPTVSQRMDIL